MDEMDIKKEFPFGPYWRSETEDHKVFQVRSSGKLYGRAPFHSGAPPAVQAFKGKPLERASYVFYAKIKHDAGSGRGGSDHSPVGMVYWRASGRPEGEVNTGEFGGKECVWIEVCVTEVFVKDRRVSDSSSTARMIERRACGY
jgi:hypothetical protein